MAQIVGAGIPANVQELVAQAVRPLEEQLKEKDQLNAELQRCVQASSEPLNREAVYDLQSKLTIAEAQVAADQSHIKLLEKALSEFREQADLRLKAAKEHAEGELNMKQQDLMKLESERDAQNLEILRYKGQCDQLKSKQQDIQKELAATKISQNETLCDLSVSACIEKRLL